MVLLSTEIDSMYSKEFYKKTFFFFLNIREAKDHRSFREIRLNEICMYIYMEREIGIYVSHQGFYF